MSSTALVVHSSSSYVRDDKQQQQQQQQQQALLLYHHNLYFARVYSSDIQYKQELQSLLSFYLYAMKLHMESLREYAHERMLRAFDLFLEKGILPYLDAFSLCQCSSVSHELLELSSSHILWEQLLRSKFTLTSEAVTVINNNNSNSSSNSSSRSSNNNNNIKSSKNNSSNNNNNDLMTSKFEKLKTKMTT